MATAAQCLANHANAQLSTGPRTGQGKARSAQNHLSHGLSSREFIVLPGQQAEFEEFSAGLREAVQPVGALEFDLFTQLAHASWKLRRCRCAEVQLYNESACPDLDPVLAPETEARLRGILIYTQRAERTYHKALKELKALQSERAFVTTAEYGRMLSKSDAAVAAPLSEKHKVVAPRMALIQLEVDAQNALARPGIAELFGFSLPGSGDGSRTPNASAVSQRRR